MLFSMTIWVWKTIREKDAAFVPNWLQAQSSDKFECPFITVAGTWNHANIPDQAVGETFGVPGEFTLKRGKLGSSA